MSTVTHSDPPINQLPEAAREMALRAADAAGETAKKAAVAAKDVTGVVEDADDVGKDVAKRATDRIKNIYQSAALKAGDTLATSEEYVRRNPVRVVLGAIAFGVAIGYVLTMARRKPTFSERYADEPLGAVRAAFLGALAPVAHRVHEGYDSARNGAGNVKDRVCGFRSGRNGNSFSHRIGRIGNHLKFW